MWKWQIHNKTLQTNAKRSAFSQQETLYQCKVICDNAHDLRAILSYQLFWSYYTLKSNVSVSVFNLNAWTILIRFLPWDDVQTRRVGDILLNIRLGSLKNIQNEQLWSKTEPWGDLANFTSSLAVRPANWTNKSLFCSMIAVIYCTIIWKSSRFPNEFQLQWYIIRPYDSPALSKIAKNIHNNKLHAIKKDERLSIKPKLKVDIHQTLFSVLSLHWAQLPAKLTVLRANPWQ